MKKWDTPSVINTSQPGIKNHPINIQW